VSLVLRSPKGYATPALADHRCRFVIEKRQHRQAGGA